MARGVGSLTVSVNAHTARAIKNLKDFQSEARQTGKAAKDMAASFQGSTIADFEKRFGGAKGGKASKQQAADLNSFRSAVVDLRNDTSRYSDEAMRQVGIVKQVNQAMTLLKNTVKAASAAVIVGFGSFKFGQGLRGHIEYIYSFADAWRELKSVFGQGQSGFDQEMAQLDALMKKIEELGRKQDEAIEKRRQAEEAWKKERFETTADLERQKAVKMFGEDFVLRAEELKKFGPVVAQRNFQLRKDLAYLEDVERKKKEKQQADEERARERERKHKEEMGKQAQAERKIREKARQDDEAVQGVRNRIKDFGKSDLERERDELLRTLNPEKRAAARSAFNRLESLQNAKDLGESLRTKFVSAQDPLSREGSAQRVRTLAQSQGNGLAQKSLTEQQKTRVAVERMANREPVVLMPANL